MELLYSYITYIRVQRDRSHTPHPEFEEMKSIIKYTQALHREDIQSHLTDTQVWAPSGPQQVERDWPAPVPSEKDSLALVYPSPAYSFYFHDASGHPFSHKSFGIYSPLQHISFDPFRPLGFAFWSQERMAGYGVLNPGIGRDFYPHLYFFAWQSILSDDELAEVERRNRVREESGWISIVRRELERDYMI